MMLTENSTGSSAVRPPDSAANSPTRRIDRWTYAALAFVAYIPILLTSPGQVSADTKAYLLLDPSKLLSRAPYMWDAHINAGTVTHQNIGYVFPLGPWYWTFRTLGVPTWIAERLWFGTLLFLAGAGTLWLFRKLGLRGPGSAVAAFVYMLSPYALAYMGRTSVILTPWCALPWLIGLMISALRERTWRAPVLFALIVTAMAGTNASSVIFVLLGPLLLAPFAVWITKETSLKEAFKALLRIAVATAPAQLWWLSGLYTQGNFGLPILQLTETVETVAQTSTAPEVLRGLGYWYFYGKDGLAGWTESGGLYTTSLAMLALTFALPLFGLLGAILTRWKYRAYFVSLIVVGLVFAIGTYPYRDPSPIGALIKFTTSLEVGFALRNSPRIVPLLVLGIAGLTAAFVDALIPAIQRRFTAPVARRLSLALPLGLICIAILNLPPLWTGGLVQSDLKFPSTLPEYWTDAAEWLNTQDGGFRVLELPGADFGAYRWGETQDPLTPGLIDRPWIGREITAYGSPASVDLLRALDRPFQEGVGEPQAIAGVARLFSASDVLLRLDSQYERYRGPIPSTLWNQLGGTTPSNGLGSPTTFGMPVVNVPDQRQPMIDEQHLAALSRQMATPPLAIYPVDNVRPLLRSETTRQPTVLFGDGSGIVEAAIWNQLPTQRPLFYAATANASPTLFEGIRVAKPNLVITDTNRKRAQRWGTTKENNGATETAASIPLVEDPKDTRLELFPGQSASDQSVAWFGDDVANIQASTYGNIVAYSTEVRPINAIDSDPRTAWTTGGFSDVIGDRLTITYARPVTSSHVDLLQTEGNRWITKATILLDGVPSRTETLNDSSFVGSGQRVDFGGERTFTTLSVRIDDSNVTGRTNWLGLSKVGFREVTVPGVAAQEWIVTPSSGIDELAPEATSVAYIFSRLRSNPIEGFRQDTELQLRRIFRVGTAADFQLGGRARLSAGVDGALIDELVGRPGLADGYPIVSGVDYLNGVLEARPSSALDDNPKTAWTTKFDNQVRASATVTNPTPLSFDRLRLSVINDQEHSVPTALNLTLDDGVTRTVAVPDIPTVEKLGNVATVDVLTGQLSSRVVRISIASERSVTTKEYFSGGQRILPIAIAEFGLPTRVGAIPTTLPSICRSDLLNLDGRPQGFTLEGTTADALDRAPLALVPCGSANAFTSRLDAGDHRFETAKGLDTGIDIDSVELRSVPAIPANAVTDVPVTLATETGTNSYSVTIENSATPFWLVLGQSLSEGWSATVRGGPSLGSPTLIDGYANGWLIDPAITGSTFTVDIIWAPQKFVWAGLAVSAPWLIGLCAAALVLTRRRRRELAVEPEANGPEIVALCTSYSVTLFERLGLIAVVATVAALVGGLGVALAMAGVSALLVWNRRRSVIAALVVLVSIGGIVALYTGLQYRRQFPNGVEWPSGFWFAHQLGLVAVLTVAAETLIRWFLRRRSKRTQSASDANQIKDGSTLTR